LTTVKKRLDKGPHLTDTVHEVAPHLGDFLDECDDERSIVLVPVAELE
jgi:hypothetical protein